LCLRHPWLAVREPSDIGRTRWRWAVDPEKLGYLVSSRINIEAAANRFDVPQEKLAALKPDQLGVVLAILPLSPRLDRRKFNRPPAPRSKRAAMEVGDGTV
jgi:hypothetical protein